MAVPGWQGAGLRATTRGVPMLSLQAEDRGADAAQGLPAAPAWHRHPPQPLHPGGPQCQVVGLAGAGDSASCAPGPGGGDVSSGDTAPVHQEEAAPLKVSLLLTQPPGFAGHRSGSERHIEGQADHGWHELSQAGDRKL